ncbi:MAG: DUF294 nucleotidyltransferase-like domain-containing protein [Candidatus Hinthialibacter antarcticus]|nr:DUF294 nucleotidyltransferase-like domain-containing protein [Candidatus Hinthialibacter antarcticus]
MRYITNRGFFFRIILPSLLTIVLFVAILFFLLVPFFEDSILERKREMIRELTYSAWSVLAELETEERDGKLTRAEAQQRAIARIQFLRYGYEGKDYFWITDMEPRMVVHPYLPDLNNQSLTDYEDPTGKRMFVEFVNVVKQNGEGFVDYMWQWKDDQSRIVPKLSFVKQFEPWGWIIGTGIYIEDVKEEIGAITNHLIFISFGITALVSLLLTFIAWQSSNIEIQRVHAENELRASREKYKTLVEASTEGFIILANNEAFYSNQKAQDMLGYDANEFEGLSLEQLFDEAFFTQSYWEDFLSDSDVPPQHPCHLITKDGEPIEVLLSASKVVFAYKQAVLLIVKDAHQPSDNEIENGQADIHYQAMTERLDIAIFLSTLDKNPRFTKANSALLALLGYESEAELAAVSLRAIFADESAYHQFLHSLNHDGCARYTDIRLQCKDGALVHASLSAAASNANAYSRMFMGVIEDKTKQKNADNQKSRLLADMQTSQHHLMQPVTQSSAKRVSCRMEQPIHIVISLMNKNKSSAVLVESDEGQAVGIITEHDINARVLKGEIDLDRPAFEIMSSPLITLNEQALLFEAALLMAENKIRHIPIRQSNGEIQGVITDHELLFAHSHSPALLIQTIRAASSAIDLNECREQLTASIQALLESGARAQSMTRLITNIADEIAQRAIHLAIEECGPPPVAFAFIALGSEGRGEQTLITDQDNAIIYEDVDESQAESVQAYLSAVAKTVCMNLDQCGYTLCKGGVMAMNPKWLQPISVWEQYFSDWIHNPDPQAFLDLKIFFDYRLLYGEPKLVQRLTRHLHATSSGKAAFYQCLAQNTLLLKPPLGLFGNIVVQNREGRPETFDIKEAMIPIVDFARLYALQHQIQETHTVQRLTAMRERGALTESAFENAVQTYEFLMQLRLKHQAIKISQNTEADNFINPKALSNLDGAILKKAFSHITDLQSKISYDFTGSA